MENKDHQKPIDIYIGRRIRERRIKLGWTLTDLGDRLSVSHQLIQKYEHANTRISVGMLYQIAEALGTTVDDFFKGFNPEEHKGLASHETDALIFKPDQHLNILLVENSSDDELVIRQVAEEGVWDIKIHCYHDGTQALDFLRRKNTMSYFPHPDLVLASLTVPGRDGLNLLREVKRDPALRHIPVVLMATSAYNSEIMKSYQQQASGFLCKPHDVDTFIKKTRALFEYWANTTILPKHFSEPSSNAPARATR